MILCFVEEHSRIETYLNMSQRLNVVRLYTEFLAARLGFFKYPIPLRP